MNHSITTKSRRALLLAGILVVLVISVTGLLNSSRAQPEVLAVRLLGTTNSITFFTVTNLSNIPIIVNAIGESSSQTRGWHVDVSTSSPALSAHKSCGVEIGLATHADGRRVRFQYTAAPGAWRDAWATFFLKHKMKRAFRILWPRAHDAVVVPVETTVAVPPIRVAEHAEGKLRPSYAAALLRRMERPGELPA